VIVTVTDGAAYDVGAPGLRDRDYRWLIFAFSHTGAAQ
jgi:hypothetical protein